MLILFSNAVAIVRLYMDLNGRMQIEIYQLLKPVQCVYCLQVLHMPSRFLENFGNVTILFSVCRKCFSDYIMKKK